MRQLHEVIAAIALGSNLGDRAAHLESAVAAIRALPRTRLLARAAFIETEPLPIPEGMPEVDPGGPYLNAVVTIATTLGPTELLQHLIHIEAANDRVRRPGVRWEPRTLDLDLLLYGDRVLGLPGLVVPHPRLHERPFVLEPLAAIAPDLPVPTFRVTVAELAARLARRADGPGTTVGQAVRDGVS